MDWIGLKADVESGKTANYVHLPAAELDELARLALAGKALADAMRSEEQTRNAYAGYRNGLENAEDPTARHSRFKALRDAHWAARDAVPVALATWIALERSAPRPAPLAPGEEETG